MFCLFLHLASLIPFLSPFCTSLYSNGDPDLNAESRALSRVCTSLLSQFLIRKHFGFCVNHIFSTKIYVGEDSSSVFIQICPSADMSQSVVSKQSCRAEGASSVYTVFIVGFCPQIKALYAGIKDRDIWSNCPRCGSGVAL